MLLRPRQEVMVSKIMDALHKHGNTLAVAPTGAGKTIIFSAVIGRMFEQGINKACVIAHRDELISQNRSKFKEINPNLSISTVNANKKNWGGKVVFAMIETLYRPNNLKELKALDVLVIDEAHHIRATTYERVINHAKSINPNIKILGMTATPNRSDKKGLGKFLTNVADQITIQELIASGHLVLPHTYIASKENLEEANKVNTASKGTNVQPHVLDWVPDSESVVKHWKEMAAERKTVIFCSKIEHAMNVVASYKNAGIKAGMISSRIKRNDREAILEAYNTNKLQVIVNVGVLTEGWDHPPTSCVVLLRYKSSQLAMIQMIGRGLRTIDIKKHPDIAKKDCIVLDFGISTWVHGSLEQTVKLNDRLAKGEASYKNCPECGYEVSIARTTCPSCGYVWEREDYTGPVITTDFQMQEINLSMKSNYEWLDLKGDSKQFYAGGTIGWGYVAYLAERKEWCAVGGRNRSKLMPKKIEILATGDQIVCIAKASHWINRYEKDNKEWIYRPISEAQLKCLLPKYPNARNMNRYQGSALLTMRFNWKAINRVISNSKKT